MPLKFSPENTTLQYYLQSVRPASLQSLLIRIIYGNSAQRRLLISDKKTELKYWVDPFSNLGESLLSTGTYEPATQKILVDSIREGNVCIDVGANEGYFTCLMAKLVGESGAVFAIEPQSRLLPLIFKNLNENSYFNATIFNFCLSDKPSEKLFINLWPEVNTGASSIVRNYRWGAMVQETHAFNLDYLLENKKIETIDFVKIDVEGYEHEVVYGMRHALAMGKIRTLAIDYHKVILESRGINPLDIHQIFDRENYVLVDEQSGFDGYRVYRHKSLVSCSE